MVLTATLDSDRTNAALAWGLLGVLALAAVASALFGEPVWTLLAGVAIGIALVPALSYRDWVAMPPWEVLVLVTLPTASRFLSLPDTVSDVLTFVGIVGLAVLIVVELHVFSSMEMPPRFAAVSVVLLTMATAGLWTLVQFASDVVLRTSLIEGQTPLMWDLIIATAISVVAGPILAWYFERQGSSTDGVVRGRSSPTREGGDR